MAVCEAAAAGGLAAEAPCSGAAGFEAAGSDTALGGAGNTAGTGSEADTAEASAASGKAGSGWGISVGTGWLRHHQNAKASTPSNMPATTAFHKPPWDGRVAAVSGLRRVGVCVGEADRPTAASASAAACTKIREVLS